MLIAVFTVPLLSSTGGTRPSHSTFHEGSQVEAAKSGHSDPNIVQVSHGTMIASVDFGAEASLVFFSGVSRWPFYGVL